MYALLGIDAILRIAAAMALLFVVVPSLAFPRLPVRGLQRFWLCFATGTVALTLLGQLLTLVNAYASMTLLLACAALIVIARGGWPVLQNVYRIVVVGTLNVLEGRVSLRRRAKRLVRPLARHAREVLVTRAAAGWALLVSVAAVTRFYRPFATANLGFSDTYVHLYLVRLLEQGQQVDPAWGPYPRGMHFLLLAIHELTNINEILLMNFFGPFIGVLLVLAVADAARRLGKSLVAGLVAGLLFATLVGGASQYFFLGGSFAVDNVVDARRLVAEGYGTVPSAAGEFDTALTSFQRQSSTLPQEMAIVFLFPAAIFLLDWLRGSAPARLGYFACTAAIACTHPGVMVPHVILSGVAVLSAHASLAQIRRVMLLGALGTAVGSTWLIGFFAYPYTAGPQTRVNGTAYYYFPMLRRFAGDAAPELTKIVTWVSLPPVLLACIVIAILLLARRTTETTFVALAVLAFFLTHVASRWHLPEVVEIRRNAEWFAVALCIAIGVAIVSLPRRALTPALAALLIAWTWRVPNLAAAPMRDKLLNYSGYGETAYAVLNIERKLEPFTWTLVTYGQEYPMVLGSGFHLAATDFLERYDPADARLTIPTKYIFIAVEKNPHPFEINTWRANFSRSNIEERLQTWCFLYGMSHRDLRLFFDDRNVRVYEIRRTEETMRSVMNEQAALNRGEREAASGEQGDGRPLAARQPPLAVKGGGK